MCRLIPALCVQAEAIAVDPSSLESSHDRKARRQRQNLAIRRYGDTIKHIKAGFKAIFKPQWPKTNSGTQWVRKARA